MKKNKKEITYIDLFAGAGGLSEGFTAAGYTPVAHVEMNTEACRTLMTRECYYYLKRTDKDDIYKSYIKGNISREQFYSSVPKSIIDTVINQTMSEETMDELFCKIDSLLETRKNNTIDLIIGGPPCQAYSLVGRAVKGADIKYDPRNYLYKLYLNVLNRYKPKMFVFENVPGMLNANKGLYFQDLKKAFKRSGYELDYQVLNASDFGVLQNRKRVILIGWKNNSGYYYPNFRKAKYSWLVRDLLKDLPPIQPGEENNSYFTSNYSTYLKETEIRKKGDILTWHISRQNINRDREIYKEAIKEWDINKKRIKYTDLPDELCTHNNKTAFLDRFKVVASDLPACHTIMAHISKDGHYFIHPDIEQARSISVREAARIQSFPDDFFFEGSRTAAYTQIGNAVPPLMAKAIAEELRKQLEK